MGESADDEGGDAAFDAEDRAWRQAGREQAERLMDQTREGGLRFEAFLPTDLAEWLLRLVAGGTFVDPSEAVFVLLGEVRDLWTHAQDLRGEILARTCQAAMDDPRPPIPGDEVMARMREMLSKPRPEPAQWVRHRPSGALSGAPDGVSRG